MTTKEIQHEEYCTNKTQGNYSVGCSGCLYQFVKDSIKGLSLEIGDMNSVQPSEKQKYIDRLTFFMHLEKSLP